MTTETQSLRVLFVDDEENILKAVGRLFMDEPFEVLTAESGSAGLDILRANADIGVIISDQRMPGMSGAEFLEQSRSVAPEAVRLVLTGYADIASAVDAINKGGAWKYLAKPWEDDELIHTVREAAERYSLRRENLRLTEIVNRQNEELKKWNSELEFYVQQQTLDIQKKNRTLEALAERQRRNFSDTILALAGLVELRGTDMRNHSRNVSNLARRIAAGLGLSAEEVEAITIAATLHDIGKMSMSDVALVSAADSLNDDGLREYRLHPVRGQSVLDTVESLRTEGRLVRHHHERFDGSGFPDGLKGEAIPLGARIIAAADLLDRLVSKSPADNAVDEALRMLPKYGGKRLDPALVSLIEKAAPDVYTRADGAGRESAEVELMPKDLREGMIVSRDVLSGTGILLLGAGIRLAQKSIYALERHFQNDPPRGGVFVRVAR